MPNLPIEDCALNCDAAPIHCNRDATDDAPHLNKALTMEKAFLRAHFHGACACSHFISKLDAFSLHRKWLGRRKNRNHFPKLVCFGAFLLSDVGEKLGEPTSSVGSIYTPLPLVLGQGPGQCE